MLVISFYINANNHTIKYELPTSKVDDLDLYIH